MAQGNLKEKNKHSTDGSNQSHKQLALMVCLETVSENGFICKFIKHGWYNHFRQVDSHWGKKYLISDTGLYYKYFVFESNKMFMVFLYDGYFTLESSWKAGFLIVWGGLHVSSESPQRKNQNNWTTHADTHTALNQSHTINKHTPSSQVSMSWPYLLLVSGEWAIKNLSVT